MASQAPYIAPTIMAWMRDTFPLRTASPQREEIVLRLRADLPGILSAYPVMLAYLYGSVAEGRATTLSDVDIALVFNAETSLTSYECIRTELNITAEVERLCGIRKSHPQPLFRLPADGSYDAER